MVIVYYAVLWWSVMIGLPMIAQSSQDYHFDPSPVPEEIEKLKPFPEASWNRGDIKLISKEQISGYLCYEPQTETLLAYHNGTVRTFNTLHIKRFIFFDQDLRYVRSYLTIGDSSQATTKVSQVYKVLSKGQYSLLRKETKSNASYKKRLAQLGTHPDFDYFIWDGKVVWSYKYFQKHFLRTMALRDLKINRLSLKKTDSNPSLIERQRMVIALNQLNADVTKPEIKLAKNNAQVPR